MLSTFDFVAILPMCLVFHSCLSQGPLDSILLMPAHGIDLDCSCSAAMQQTLQSCSSGASYLHA